MKERSYLKFLIPGILLYLAIPLLYLLLGDFPERTLLKEFISFLVIGAFFLMLSQFYISRTTKAIVSGHKMSRIVKLHKVIGYVFIPILILHPFLIVVPRFYEAGVDPQDAFIEILTQFESRGILLGLIAMGLMILLGITSLLRKKLKLKYTSWRIFHGLLSIAFIVLATWHAVGMGRHMDTFLSIYTILMSCTGIGLLIRIYLITPSKKGESNE